MDCICTARFVPVKLGLALGLLWGISLLCLAWIGSCCPYGHAFVQLFGSVYIGYTPTLMGGLIGLVWGFIDFFIFGCLIAWLYNCFLGHPSSECKQKK